MSVDTHGLPGALPIGESHGDQNVVIAMMIDESVQHQLISRVKIQYSHFLLKITQRKTVRQRDKEVKLHIDSSASGSLLPATGQPIKEQQFPTFGSFHKQPSWRQACGQTVGGEGRESTVG